MSTIDSTKYNALVANASSGTVISSTKFKDFIGDVKDVVDKNSPEGQYAADAGASDAYAVTLSPAPTAYFTGMVVRFKANTANTGAATLNVNSLGAKTIKKNYNLDLQDNDITTNQVVEVIYDGTNFQLISPINSSLPTETAITLLNSWINFGGNYGTARYYKDEYGIVRISGFIKDGTATSGTSLFTLPSGNRPLVTEPFNVLSKGASVTMTVLQIETTGAASLIENAGNSYLILNGISFRTT